MEIEASSQKQFTPGKGALVTLVVVAMLNCMGGAAVAPALPAISEAFPQTSETVISMIITLPSLAVAITGLFVGAIADRLGKARTLAASLVLFTVSGLAGAVLPTVETILVSRFIMGIGIAGISTSSSALVSEYYDPDMRAKVFGWQSAANGASVLTLETTGGFLALLGWRVPFCVYVIGIALLVLVALFIREMPHRPSSARKSGSSSETESRNRSLTGVIVLAIGVAFVTQILSFLVPSKMPYLVTTFGGSSATSGLYLGAFGIANIAASIIYARRQSTTRRSTLTIVSFSALTLGCLLMGVAPNVWFVLVGVVLVGLGVGTVMPLFMNWLASKSTSKNSGKYMGAYATACNLGQFACSLVAGGVLAAFNSYQMVFIVAAGFGAAVTLVMIALRSFIDGKESA